MNRREQVRRWLRVWIPAVSLSVVIGGCAGKVPKQTPFMASVGTVTLTTNELRLRVYDYQSWFSSVVQSTAHKVIDTEEDTRILEAAFLWKINAIPAMQKAVFQTDPLAGLATAWGLSAQMARFFDGGAGKNLFGGSQPLVVEASRRLESEVTELMRSVIGPQEYSTIEPVVEDWVRDNPIEDLTFGGHAIGTDLAALTASKLGSGGLSAVGQIEETTRDIGDRLTIYFEQLPKQIRWNTELLLIEWNRHYGDALLNGVVGIDESHATVDENIEKLTEFVLESPELLRSERDALLETLNREGMKLLGEDVDTQRVETIEALRTEREIILTALNLEREVITTELKEAMARLEEVSARTTEMASQEAQDVIDHFFWRAFQLTLVVFFLAGILWLLTRRARPRRE